MLGALLGALLGSGSSILSSILGYQSAQQTNAINRQNILDTNKSNEAIADRVNYFNRQIAAETNATNKSIADENLRYQRELQEYQKALQQQIFEREDTSYQRTAQDMLAAGLNPLDMQGADGAGSLVSMTPLENTFQAQQSNPMVGHTNESFKQEDAFQSAISASASIGSIASIVNQIETGVLERDSLQLENDRKKLENEILANDYGLSFFGKGRNRSVGYISIGDESSYELSRGWKNRANNEIANQELVKSLRAQRELQHMQNAGIYETDTDFERVLTAISDWVNNGRGEEEWKKLEKTFPVLKAFK